MQHLTETVGWCFIVVVLLVLFGTQRSQVGAAVLAAITLLVVGVVVIWRPEVLQ